MRATRSTDATGVVHRRDFLRLCTIAAATLGLPHRAAAEMVEAVLTKKRPPVIWLHFQECTGCTESLLRTTHPSLAELLLELISLDYHETLLAAAGHQAEAALQASMAANEGKFICVVEGAIPTAANGAYCMIGGRTALDMVKDVGSKAAAVVAIGSCASWGGIPSAAPNPTGATGVPMIFADVPALRDKPVVTLPGCPANPYNLLSTVLNFLTWGKLPALDELGRPKFAYGQTIHENCPRRPHFDAGRFAERFGDEGHKAGYCLYKLGCKGPETYANCSYQHFNEVPGAWPIGVGHPCFGCTESQVGFTKPLHDTADVLRVLPRDEAPPIDPKGGEGADGVALGAAGLALGALAGAGVATAVRMRRAENLEDADPPGGGGAP